MEDLSKLSLKKLNELFASASWSEHYAIDGAQYDRAEEFSNRSYLLAVEICNRREANAAKRALKAAAK